MAGHSMLFLLRTDDRVILQNSAKSPETKSPHSAFVHPARPPGSPHPRPPRAGTHWMHTIQRLTPVRGSHPIYHKGKQVHSDPRIGRSHVPAPLCLRVFLDPAQTVPTDLAVLPHNQNSEGIMLKIVKNSKSIYKNLIEILYISTIFGFFNFIITF
ncbi:unnamed protein product [Meloidogyne enterolobii]|uniref:Uncharacterized protein n=1 Tax=Meloidogyne enterolobii TaxID=390850 RepID=A0ACB0YZ56_MELEN